MRVVVVTTKRPPHSRARRYIAEVLPPPPVKATTRAEPRASAVARTGGARSSIPLTLALRQSGMAALAPASSPPLAPDDLLTGLEEVLQLHEAGEIVGRGENVDVRQRRTHALAQGLVAGAGLQRVEPDHAGRAAAQLIHLLLQHGGLASVPAIAKDQHYRAAVHHTARVQLVEGA